MSNKTKLLPTSPLQRICSNCKAECCKRYWITLLPADIERLASHLRLSIPDFISLYTQLYLRLFPVQFHDSTLCISVSQLPKSIVNLVRAQNCYNEFFTLAPFLALKRSQNTCTFLDKKFTCSVYPVRPTPCQLFPFTDDLPKSELMQSYSFCKLIEFDQPNEKLRNPYSRDVSNYFSSIKSHGFSSLFPILPPQGVVFLSGQLLGKISKKEFLECLQPFL